MEFVELELVDVVELDVELTVVVAVEVWVVVARRDVVLTSEVVETREVVLTRVVAVVRVTVLGCSVVLVVDAPNEVTAYAPIPTIAIITIAIIAMMELFKIVH
jgi:hypothetical protein